VIFSRGRGSGRHAKSQTTRGARHAASEPGFDDEVEEYDETDEAPAGLRVGPYDVSEAPRGMAQIDLGALLIPMVDGVELQVQADPEGRIVQVLLVHDTSGLQLGAFAAPRSEGIWDEVRGEIRKQLFNDGVAAEEVDGEYGTELRARVRTPNGMMDMRFVGVNGPRWLLRAVYQGPAAVDPSVAEPLRECLRQLVVNRGIEAMPVREPLPLRLPKEVADQAKVQQTGTDGTEPDGANGAAPSGRPSPGGRRKPSPRPRPRR
jgi:hypothetical protein